jgi:hypothetical protein
MIFVRVGTASQATPVERLSSTSVRVLLVGGALEHRGCSLALSTILLSVRFTWKLGFRYFRTFQKCKLQAARNTFEPGC